MFHNFRNGQPSIGIRLEHFDHQVMSVTTDGIPLARLVRYLAYVKSPFPYLKFHYFLIGGTADGCYLWWFASPMTFDWATLWKDSNLPAWGTGWHPCSKYHTLLYTQTACGRLRLLPGRRNAAYRNTFSSPCPRPSIYTNQSRRPETSRIVMRLEKSGSVMIPSEWRRRSG